MRRTFAAMVLALFFFSLSFTSTAQTTSGGGQPGSMTESPTDPQSLGSGRTYGEVNR